MKYLVSLLLGAALAGAGLTAAAHAANNSPTATAKSQSADALAVVTRPLRLVTTKVSSDSGLVAFPAGFTAIDALTSMNCPATATNCVIVATQNVQIRSAAAGNNWAICTKVDGVFVSNPNCPFLGPVPVATFAANSFAQSSGALAPGAHTVQTFLFFSFAADRSIYEITYSLYK